LIGFGIRLTLGCDVTVGINDQGVGRRYLVRIATGVALLAVQFHSHDGVINQLQFVDLHQLDDKYLDTYVQKVYAVTPQQVQEMAQKYVAPAAMERARAGDSGPLCVDE
jgi:hypothetical protein